MRGSWGGLRVMAVAAAVVGAVGSEAFMLHAGRNNKSLLLLLLFTIWVLSPFIGLLAVDRISRRWPAPVVAVLSLAIYGFFALRPPRAQAAAVFVVVPLVSWLLIAIVVLVGALKGGRGSRI